MYTRLYLYVHTWQIVWCCQNNVCSEHECLLHTGAETVHEIVVKANEWLQSMEGHLQAQLVSSLWGYYLFLQTAEEVDWSQPMVTVFQGLSDSKLLEAAQTCSCLDSVLQEISTALIQYVGVPSVHDNWPT